MAELGSASNKKDLLIFTNCLKGNKYRQLLYLGAGLVCVLNVYYSVGYNRVLNNKYLMSSCVVSGGLTWKKTINLIYRSKYFDYYDLLDKKYCGGLFFRSAFLFKLCAYVYLYFRASRKFNVSVVCNDASDITESFFLLLRELGCSQSEKCYIKSSLIFLFFFFGQYSRAVLFDKNRCLVVSHLFRYYCGSFNYVARSFIS